MADAYFVKSLAGLSPADDEARQLVSGIPLGDTVRATIRRPRNLKRHKWLWALASLVAENSDRTPEEVVTLLKLATGHRDEMHLKPGPCPHCGCDVERVAYIPKSISFAKMDETEFTKFCNRCVQVVITRLLPGVTEAEVREQIEEMIGLRRAA